MKSAHPEFVGQSFHYADFTMAIRRRFQGSSITFDRGCCGWYNYRRVPAVTMAKNLIDDLKAGRVAQPRAFHGGGHPETQLRGPDRQDGGGVRAARPTQHAHRAH